MLLGMYDDTQNRPLCSLSTVLRLTGDPQKTKRFSQTVNISGSEGDTFVLAGWAKGDSAPLNSDEEDTNVRRFGLVATFHNTDGTNTEHLVCFNPDMDSQNTWQYAATPVIADKAYSSVQISVVYDYNVNTAYFDGIQLYKEEFGTSYTYDEYGNVTSVTDLQKQKTTYTFAENELTSMVLPSGVSYTYDYDDYHNVETATTSMGQVYEFDYDDYGNNISVTITAGGMSIRSEAEYTDDGNYLKSTTDAAGNETVYGYNLNTGVLEWVQYPEDTATTKTTYTNDEMYRMATVAATTDTGKTLYADYYYDQDQLTAIETDTTYYAFNYGDFDLVSSIWANGSRLASYEYTDDQNYYLKKLAYGNGDSVEYEYDNVGRVTKQTYEDGDTVTYQYDNNGALATVTSSDTGLKTNYYYDFSSRMMKYVESGNGFSHSVGYAYDNINNLTSLVETINGVEYTTSYTYDGDNRIETVTTGGVTRNYDYDDYGRITQEQTLSGNTVVMTKVYTYRNISATTTTTQIATCRVYGGDYDVTYTYAYDDNGNILSISDGTYTTSYVYDSQNQLIRENNQEIYETYIWEYDNVGNILNKSLYEYSTEDAPDYLYYSNDYSYGGYGTWGDVLVGVGNITYTVDALGNRTSRTNGSYTTNYTWEHGRQLASVGNWQYSYNNDGMLIEQRNGNDVYTYVYNGTQLSQMKFEGSWDEYTMHFTYDANGTPLTVTFDYVCYMDDRTFDETTGAFLEDAEIDYTISDTYYYITNIQGDVIELLNSDGESAGYYRYDAWGYDIDMWDLEEIIYYNPLRYRGYFLDPVSNLYYLQTRFYDASVGRFISPDKYVSTGQGLHGYNMFAYCNNNPVMLYDQYGEFPWFAVITIAVLVVAGVAWGLTRDTKIITSKPVETTSNEPHPLPSGQNVSPSPQNNSPIAKNNPPIEDYKNEDNSGQSVPQELSTLDRVENAFVGAGLGLLVGGGVVSLMGLAGSVVAGSATAYIGLFGGTGLQTTAIGALSIDLFVTVVAPFIGVEMEPIEITP